MNQLRNHRSFWTFFRPCLFLAICSFCTLSNAHADEFSSKKLQEQVYQTIDKVMPAVVAVRDRTAVFSAVVVSKDGLVASAGHAVQPGRRYSVFFSDGKRRRAVGLGSNQVVDCAMLKITDEGEYPYVEMGKSAVLSTNQPVVGISHPGILNEDRGAVVRFGRIIQPVTPNEGMILSSVKIEPGDSGGALLDVNGKLIGIHSNIRRSAEENYAVPIDTYKKLWEQLVEPDYFDVSGWPSLPTLGFRGRPSEDRVGLEVVKVYENGLAEKSGLKPGDVITKIDSRTVNSAQRVRSKLIEIRIANQKSFDMKVRRNTGYLDLEFQVLPNVPLPESYSELENLESQFTSLEAKLDDLAVRIKSQIDSRPLEIRGTRLAGSNAGKILSKSSMVGENPRVKVSTGNWVSAQILKRDPKNDLILLSARLPGKAGIDLSRVTGDVPAKQGKLLLSPDPDGEGVISVWGSKYFNAPKTRASGGFLGVVLGADQRNRVYFREVTPGGAARTAGARAGDIVLKMNDTIIRRTTDVFDFLRGQDPYKKIKMVLDRDGETLEKDLVLGQRPEFSNHVADNLVGGKSTRRDGFQVVLSHDADIRPEECGGPVFDLNGGFVGMNISRYSRTQCYVLPKTFLKQFVGGN